MDMMKVLSTGTVVSSRVATAQWDIQVKPSLENLASEAFSEIASHLSEKDILSLRATSKDMQSQVQNLSSITEGLVEVSRKIRDTENPMDPSVLPKELFYLVGQHLSREDILALRLVSKGMNDRANTLDIDANDFIQSKISRGHKREARLNALETKALGVFATAENAWFFSDLTDEQITTAFWALIKTGNYEEASKMLHHMSAEILKELKENPPAMLVREGKALLRSKIDGIRSYRRARDTVLIAGAAGLALVGLAWLCRSVHFLFGIMFSTGMNSDEERSRYLR